jgi:hypothetical protein
MIVRRIEPFSAAKVGGMLYAILGLIAAVLITLFSSAIGGMMGTSGAGMGAMFGIGSIILFPILYGICGFILTLIMSVVYNAAAKFVGGIEIQVD